MDELENMNHVVNQIQYGELKLVSDGSEWRYFTWCGLPWQDHLVRVPVGDTRFGHVRIGSFAISPSQNFHTSTCLYGQTWSHTLLGGNTTTTRRPEWQQTIKRGQWSGQHGCYVFHVKLLLCLMRALFIEFGCYVIIP
jgi:hypothetical protein